MAFVENPILLGVAASIIVWLAQRFDPQGRGRAAIWLTGLAALLLAAGNELWVMGEGHYEVQIMVKEFMEFAATLPSVGRQVISRAVPIFITAQVVHESLRTKLAGKVIYGASRTLRRSLDGYEYLAAIVTGVEYEGESRGTSSKEGMDGGLPTAGERRGGHGGKEDRPRHPD